MTKTLIFADRFSGQARPSISWKRRGAPFFVTGRHHESARFSECDLGCLRLWRSDNSFMSEHIYKKIELVGSSPEGFDAAVQNAVSRANKTVRNMRWFEVIETRGEIEEGRVNHWQVTLKVGFTLDK